MNNIIKEQAFLCKKRIWFFVLVMAFLLPYCFFFMSLSETVAESFGALGLTMVLLVMGFPIFVILKSYAERIQLYEIMAGFKPHQLLLGKALVYLPFTLLSLICFSVMVLTFDSSTGTVQRLLLLCVICIRATLCIVFLSPLLKESVVAPTFSAMLLLVYGSSELQEVALSPISFLAFGQGVLLSLPVTEEYVVKVIVSAIISCAIYYYIGYMTLKKRIDLEPHKFT